MSCVEVISTGLDEDDFACFEALGVAFPLALPLFALRGLERDVPVRALDLAALGIVLATGLQKLKA